MKRFAIALATLGALQVGVAQALYTCTNERGIKSFQDEPCATRAPNSALAPVRAEALGDAVVRETMKRYEGAMSTGDSVSVARLLSPALQRDLTMLDRSKSQKMDYFQFTNAVKRMHDATPGYRMKLKCKPGKAPSAGVYVMECVADEESKIQGRVKLGQSNETFHFVVENGEVKIREMVSVQVAERLR